MPGKSILFGLLFFLFCNSHASGQTERKYSLSELKRLSDTQHLLPASRFNLRISQFYITNKTANAQNLDSALYFVKEAERLAAKARSADDLTNARLQEALVYNEMNKVQLSKKMLKTADLKFKIRLDLSLAAYYVYKPGELKSDLDSADYFITDAIKISDILHNVYSRHIAQLYQCDVLNERGELIKSRDGFLKLVKDCLATGDIEGAAMTYTRMGDHITMERADEKISYYNEAKRLYRQISNKEAEIYILKAIGDVHLNTGHLNLAKEELLTVVKWYKDNDYHQLQDIYYLLANVARWSGDFSSALYYGIETINCANKMESDKALGYFYNSLAQVYNESGDEEQSVVWYRKTIEALGKQNSELMYNSLKDISNYLIKQNRESEVLKLLNEIKPKSNPSGLEMELIAAIKGACYNKQGKFELAEQSYLEMIKWEQYAKMHTYNSADSYQTIAEFYMSRNEYAKAEFYLKKILLNSSRSASLAKIKDVYLDLYKADSAKHDPESAIIHYKKYKALNDSIFNQTKNWQIQELTIKYNTAQLNRDNILLRKESQFEKDKLQKASLITKITISGIIFLLFLLGVVYKSFLNRQKHLLVVAAYQKEIELKNGSLENMIIKQEKLLEDKEWLIKEIHHRVKNNLQVVMALLSTQADYLENGEAIRAITDSQNRMYSISLIHQKLFQSEEVTQIDIKPYITDLIKFICDTFHFNQSIAFEFDVDSVKFDINQAMPLGLIINEAITNIIKYAFPNGRNGIVRIVLKNIADNQYVFIIADDGVGLPEGFNLDESSTLGMVLMRGLSGQINGNLTIRNNNGVLISLIFELEQTLFSEQNIG